MITYIYSVMLTAKKDGGKYKTKLFNFANKQVARKAFNRLAKELESVAGEKPTTLRGDNCVTICYLGKDYYSITFRQDPVSTLNDADLNLNFQDDEN